MTPDEIRAARDLAGAVLDHVPGDPCGPDENDARVLADAVLEALKYMGSARCRLKELREAAQVVATSRPEYSNWSAALERLEFVLADLKLLERTGSI